MKSNHNLLRLALVSLVCLCLTVGASAASWPAGTSPAQPYQGRPAADLQKTLGYFMLYPTARVPAAHYCNELVIYLPREDVGIGTGEIRLYQGNGDLLLTVNVADSEAVSLVPMTEDELNGLMWGSGVAYRVRLPFSLSVGESYYAEVDQGVITVPGTIIINGAITGNDKWQPSVSGDYGISGLHYIEGHSFNLADVGPDQAKLEADYEPVVKLIPDQDDLVVFDLILGGDAASAVTYTPDDSVTFLQQTYTAADANAQGLIEVSGTLNASELGTLGVFFLNEAGDVIQIIMINGTLE